MNDLHEMDKQLVQKEVAELSELELETVASGKQSSTVVAGGNSSFRGFGFRRRY